MLILFTLPMVIYTFIFSYIPMVGTIIAFQDFKFDLGLFGSPWVGLSNFKFLFQMVGFGQLIRNTILYNIVFILSGTFVTLLLAFLLFELGSVRAVKLYQNFMFLPYYLSWVSVAYIGVIMLNYNMGLINQLLTALGFGKVNFYNTASAWPVILPVVNLWKSLAVNTAIYYAALLAIDPEYREAALIEGATRFQIIRHIYLPFLYPMLIILHILAVGSIFNSDFGLFYQFTLNSAMTYSTTDVLDTYIFRALIDSPRYGMSSAAGLMKSCIGMVLILATNGIVRKLDKTLSLF